MSATDQPISFEQHIKPLFREGDRVSMKWAFDLWSHDDVAGNSDAILERLRDGTMPCDGAWSEEQIALFHGLGRGGSARLRVPLVEVERRWKQEGRGRDSSRNDQEASTADQP